MAFTLSRRPTTEANFLVVHDRPELPAEYIFRRSFRAPSGATMTARLTADSRYILSVNGRFVCDGPCRGAANERFYETVDLTPYLTEGENEIVTRVLYLPVDSWILSTVFRHGAPALWFEGKLTMPDGTAVSILSDEGFTCEKVTSARFDWPGANVHWSVPPAETRVFPQKTTPVCCGKGDRPHIADQPFNEYGVHFACLSPRPIPLIQPGPDRPLHVIRSGDGWWELDAGVYTVAIPHIAYSGHTGAVMHVMWAESYKHPDGKKGRRDVPDGELIGPVDTLTLADGDATYAPFFARAFRYLRIECDDPAVTLRPDECFFNDYAYPLEQTGVFACSDKSLENMWDVSIRTLLSCMQETYMDCPHYEQQSYDMDGFLEMMYTYRLSGDVRMQEKTIREFAASQRPDGMLCAHYPSFHMQVITGFPIFWIFMLREHLRYTGNAAYVRSYLGTLDKLLGAYDSFLNEDGLIGFTPYWSFIDWVPGWDTGTPDGDDRDPLTVESLLYVAGLRAGAEVCEMLGRPGVAAEYRARAEKVSAAVNRFCYDEEKGLYRNAKGRSTYCQQNNVWAVLSDTVTGDAATELMRRTMTEDLPKCSHSMNYFLFRALEKTGLWDEFADPAMEGWRKMLSLGCTTWCENPDDPRSECHGWSSVPLYEFSAKILGVTPAENGYAATRVSPNFRFGGLTYARGTVPTPAGNVSVSWEKKDGKVILDVTAPAAGEMPLVIALPGREEFRTTEKTVHVAVDLAD